LGAYSSAREASAPDASPLMTQIERQLGRKKYDQMDAFLSDGGRQNFARLRIVRPLSHGQFCL
jgi:hypothetical protein